MDDLKDWMDQPLRKGYMEVAIVGDIDPDRALNLVAKTLGALPQRSAVKPSFAKERQIVFPTAKGQEFRFASQTPRAMDLVCWPTDGSRDAARDLRTGILAQVLGDRVRLKVRQQLGASYSPSVVSAAPDAFPDYGFIEADLTVEPQQAAKIGSLVAKMGADLAAGSIGDDEFDRAMKPMLSNLDVVLSNNGYWLNVLGHCQERPSDLDFVRGVKDTFRSVTKQEIESLAKKYLAEGQATVISVVPASTEK
jgi:zinc protease